MGNVQKEGATGLGLVVAVVGSRSVDYCPALWRRLRELRPALVVTGGAAGADDDAQRCALALGLSLATHLPDYRAHGQAAPLVRNGLVVAGADLVLVVWDGQSRGTLDAARKAARLGKRLEWLLHPAPSATPVPGGLGL